METRRVIAADIVQECSSSGNRGSFDKDLFREVIFELQYELFNRFCLDVLRLEYHHHVSVGKWCTESPHQFRNGELNFYRITYDVDPAQLINLPYCELLYQSRISPDLFSKRLFLHEITLITGEDFNCFCENIAKLHIHKLLVECFYFTDDPDDARSKLMIVGSGQHMLFQLQGINRCTNSPSTRSNWKF